jgi:hypothetical protein
MLRNVTQGLSVSFCELGDGPSGYTTAGTFLTN